MSPSDSSEDELRQAVTAVWRAACQHGWCKLLVLAEHKSGSYCLRTISRCTFKSRNATCTAAELI